ncbi:MAG: hypothetical protein EA381_05130 [Planctomycetaceae bacterium]|nr:MAG: hypothetical protein EA381_05130 [Planctomycetaceae bacterium]
MHLQFRRQRLPLHTWFFGSLTLVASPLARAGDDGNWISRGMGATPAEAGQAFGGVRTLPFWSDEALFPWVVPVAHPSTPLSQTGRSTLKLVVEPSSVAATETTEHGGIGQLELAAPLTASSPIAPTPIGGGPAQEATTATPAAPDFGLALEGPQNQAEDVPRVAVKPSPSQPSEGPGGPVPVGKVGEEKLADLPSISVEPEARKASDPSLVAEDRPLQMRRLSGTAVSQVVGDLQDDSGERGAPGRRAFIGDWDPTTGGQRLADAGSRQADRPAGLERSRQQAATGGDTSAVDERTEPELSIGEDEDGWAEPLLLKELAGDSGEVAVEPDQIDQPIRGDRITAAGELMLASGRTAASAPLTPQAAKLKPIIERVLKHHWERPEDAAIRTHWGMMHTIMVFDKDTDILWKQDRYNAVAWMAGNNPCRNELLFSEDEYGISVRTGVGLQGHQAQLLAIFGQINVPIRYPLYVGKNQYSVADVLQREMRDCKEKSELTFTLIGLSHYADTDSTWVAADGQEWDFERLLKEELAQPVVGAACGGTHRLMGFAHSLRRRRAEGKPITGQWDRADRYLHDFVNYTWTLQNRDGSMSTAWFERREDNGNVDRKIQTTGHLLEFLLVTTPDAELQDPRLLRTVEFLSTTMQNERGRDWQVGPKGHALRSLAMYYQRVYGDSTPWRAAEVERATSRPVGTGGRTR